MRKKRVVVCVCVCVCVCVRVGILLCNLQVVIPGTLTTVMPIARHGSDGLASRAVPSDTSVSLKTKACKTNVTRKSVSRVEMAPLLLVMKRNYNVGPSTSTVL